MDWPMMPNPIKPTLFMAGLVMKSTSGLRDAPPGTATPSRLYGLGSAGQPLKGITGHRVDLFEARDQLLTLLRRQMARRQVRKPPQCGRGLIHGVHELRQVFLIRRQRSGVFILVLSQLVRMGTNGAHRVPNRDVSIFP